MGSNPHLLTYRNPWRVRAKSKPKFVAASYTNFAVISYVEAPKISFRITCWSSIVQICCVVTIQSYFHSSNLATLCSKELWNSQLVSSYIKCPWIIKRWANNPPLFTFLPNFSIHSSIPYKTLLQQC